MEGFEGLTVGQLDLIIAGLKEDIAEGNKLMASGIIYARQAVADSIKDFKGYLAEYETAREILILGGPAI